MRSSDRMVCIDDGTHADDAYSRIGLTMALYAVLLFNLFTAAPEAEVSSDHVLDSLCFKYCTLP